MTFFGRLALVGAIGAGLFGCAETVTETNPSVPDIPPDTPLVSISNGGSPVYGSNRTAIYQGDIVVYSFDIGAGGPGPRVTYGTLRAGGYGRLRDAALDLIEETAGLVGDGLPCEDYGMDMIEVVDPETTVRLAAGCPDNPVIAAQRALRTVLAQETAE